MFSLPDKTELMRVLDFFDVPMFAAERASIHEHFRMIGVNAAHTAATSLTTEQIAGKTPHDILGPEDADNVAGHYHACVTGRHTIAYNETLQIHGVTRHWRTTLQSVVMPGGGQRVIGIAMEIHDASQVSALSDTSYYAAQAQMKIGQLEAFLTHLESRDDLPVDARSQAMMVAGLTRSLDAVLADIQSLTSQQMHKLPREGASQTQSLTMDTMQDGHWCVAGRPNHVN